jgi:hypothetical protein
MIDWFFFVDDIIIICLKENLNRMRFFEKSLIKKFEMRILKKLKWFLKIQIIRNRVKKKIWLCQNSYISKMMTKFYLEEMKIFKTFLAKIFRINEKAKHENSNSQRIICFSTKNEIIELCSDHFQTRHNLCDCKTRSILEKFEFESCDDDKQSDCLFEWH